MSKNKAAAALGKKGGKAGTGKAKARTTEQTRAAANKRWAKQKPTCYKCGYGFCEPFDKCPDCGGSGVLPVTPSDRKAQRQQ
jgi:rRNA maturation endonuclease Nob1